MKYAIYFIRCPAMNAVKIGFTSDPYKRMASMQVGCPAELVMHGYFQGKMGDERWLHSKFGSQRIRGEWFTESKEMLAFFDEVIAKGMPRYTQEQNDEFDRFVRQIYAPVDTAFDV